MAAPSLIERFNLRLPIVQAPMAGGATTPTLVAEVCQAGAFGLFGGRFFVARTNRVASR